MQHNRTQTHRRRMAAQNKARTRPCKRCGIEVYFQRCGVGFRAMNKADGSVHRCDKERADG